jgi:two-component system OmpR family response regulator
MAGGYPRWNGNSRNGARAPVQQAKKLSMSEPPSILIVDDDERLCRGLARYLRQENYRVQTAQSAVQLHELLAVSQPDLVILDLMLPDADGFDLARELRATFDFAIVMLTGKADTVDKVVGLELGADDYITKPFDPRELLARVRSVLRRASVAGKPREAGSVACFGGWKLDLTAYELWDPEGEPVPLTTHEFKLLAALIEHHHQVVTRSAILDLLTQREWTPYDRSVDVLVAKLRKKLGDDSQQPSLIKTIRGIGYMLTATVDFRG